METGRTMNSYKLAWLVKLASTEGYDTIGVLDSDARSKTFENEYGRIIIKNRVKAFRATLFDVILLFDEVIPHKIQHFVEPHCHDLYDIGHIE